MNNVDALSELPCHPHDRDMPSITLKGNFMGFKWLNNKNWSEVTRDERFFCAHLYKTVLEDRRGIPFFVEQINKQCGLELPVNANWELGFEVCFYRDMAFAFPEKYDMLSPKRTFDLCLFSDDTIVIIEAKAYQAFDGAQTKEFLEDVDNIEKTYNLPVKVVLIPLASSLYEKTFNKNMKQEFGCTLLTWGHLSGSYGADTVLKSADQAFGLRPKAGDKSKQYMTGCDLIRMYENGEVDPQTFWVGRSQGERGLSSDLEDYSWRDRLYEIISDANAAPNKNWFSLKTFVSAVSGLSNT